MRSPIPLEILERRSHLIQGQRVLLDVDLARLYGVSLQALRQKVSRQKSRFPSDFIIRLTNSSYAFTEPGILMFSSVLKSPRAAEVSIELIRSLFSVQHIFEC